MEMDKWRLYSEKIPVCGNDRKSFVVIDKYGKTFIAKWNEDERCFNKSHSSTDSRRNPSNALDVVCWIALPDPPEGAMAIMVKMEKLRLKEEELKNKINDLKKELEKVKEQKDKDE